jgi:RHS repeat-associated protein
VGGGWTENWTFYGAQGEKLVTNLQLWGPLEVYNYNGTQVTGWTYSFQGGQSAIWFAGKMIYDGGAMYQDRLGTNRSGGARFRPYGDEITSTGNDRVKFGTYTRDSLSGLDYADQRFYASGYGRFNTADPMKSSAGANDPGSWNRYAYVGGDPINSNDPAGLLAAGISTLPGYDPSEMEQVVCLGQTVDYYVDGSFANSACLIASATKAVLQVVSTEPVIPDCKQSLLNALGLDYSQKLYRKGTQTTEDHIIQRHGGNITGSPVPGVSQYYAATFFQIKNINFATFVFGTEQYDPLRNSFDFTWTAPQITPGGNHLGTDPSGTETATNRLIVAADCKTVITSYPVPGID